MNPTLGHELEEAAPRIDWGLIKTGATFLLAVGLLVAGVCVILGLAGMVVPL